MIYFDYVEAMTKPISQTDILIISVGSGMAFFLIAGLIFFIFEKRRKGKFSEGTGSFENDSEYSPPPLDILAKMERENYHDFHVSSVPQLRSVFRDANDHNPDDYWLLFSDDENNKFPI